MIEKRIHNPERLPDESQQAYKFRRHLSERLAERTTVVHPVKVEANRQQRRAAAKAARRGETAWVKL